jgi:hypothetical protein
MTGLDDLSALDLDRLQLLVVQASGDQVPSGSLSLSEDVAEELRGVVQGVLDDIITRRPVPWSAQATLEDDEYWVVEREQLLDDSPALIGLERAEHPDVDPAWLDDKSRVIYAIAVGQQPTPGSADSRALFVRKKSPVLTLKRKVAAFWNEALQVIDYPLVALDRTIDLVVLPGRGMLVFNAIAFEQLFRDAPELLARTPAAVHALASAVNMTPNAEAALVDAATRYARVRRRVIAAAERGHLPTVTPAALRAELRRWGFSPTKHYRAGQLSFDEDEALTMIKVLNEDLLESGLTGTHFEVDRKTPLA